MKRSARALVGALTLAIGTVIVLPGFTGMAAASLRASHPARRSTMTTHRAQSARAESPRPRVVDRTMSVFTRGHRASVRVSAVTGVASSLSSSSRRAGSPSSHASHSSGSGTVSSFTWTGTDTTAATPNFNWSDGNNWQGGSAPADGATVDLVFPKLTCLSSTAGCGESNNDLTSLTVDQMSIIDNTTQGTGSYSFSGNGISLGGLSVTTADSGTGTPLAYLDLPVSLTGSETWTVAGGGVQDGLYLASNVTGSGSLTISESGSADINTNDPISVASFTASGANSAESGQTSFVNGELFLQSSTSFTFSGGGSLAVDDVGFGSEGAPAFGPLQTSGAYALVGNEGFTPEGTTAISGSLTLDSGSIVQYADLTAGNGTPVAGTDYPQVTATGSAALNGVALPLLADCGLADGTAFTLVSAASLSGEISYQGSAVPEGGVVQAEPDSSSSCSGAQPPYLQIAYAAAGTLTATVVAQPMSSTALSSSPTSPVVGQPTTLTATIADTPTEVVPSGTVAFTSDGNPISGCSDTSVSSTSPYIATCDTSFPSASSFDLLATFTPSGGALETGSSGTDTLSVGAASTTTVIAASTTAPSAGQPVTLTATVAAAAPGSGTPTGNVAFNLDGSPITACGAQPLNGASPDTATCDTTFTSGNHTLAAVYAGTTDFSGSSSGNLSITVSATYSSSTSLSSTVTAPVVGQPDTLVATVTPATGGPAPTGTVAFSTPSGTISGCSAVALSASSPYEASCSTSFDAAGTLSLTAAFSSSEAALTSSSGSLSLTVGEASSSVSLTAKATRILQGNKDTFTARVSVVSPGAAPIGGHVAFLENGKTLTGCGAVAVSAETAICTAEMAVLGARSLVAQYSGSTQLAGSKSSAVTVEVTPRPGYLLVTSAGAVYGFDGAKTHGSMAGKRLPAPVVGMATTLNGGYYLVTSKGNVYGFGAKVYGSLAGKRLPAPIVGIAVTPASGYYLATSKGNVYGFGGAKVHGSLAGKRFTGSVVAITAAPEGGYLLATSAGAVYGFDGAKTHGSMAGKRLPAPVVGMAITTTGGYYLVTSKGNVYGFGAKLHGSLAGKQLASPVIGVTATASGGYYLATSKGAVYGFGGAKVQGSLAGKRFSGSVVGITVA